jgi:hypothetical protein
MARSTRHPVEEIEEFAASEFADLFGAHDEPGPAHDESPADWEHEDLAAPETRVDIELDDEEDGWPTPESASYKIDPATLRIAEDELDEDLQEQLVVRELTEPRRIGAEPGRGGRRDPPARTRRGAPDPEQAADPDAALARRPRRNAALALTAGLMVVLAVVVVVSYGGSRPRAGVAAAAVRSVPAPAPVVAPAPVLARVQRQPSTPASTPPPAAVARRASRPAARRKPAPHRKPPTAVAATRAPAPSAPQRQPSPAPSTPSTPPARVYAPLAAAAPATPAAASSPAPGLSYLGGGR